MRRPLLAGVLATLAAAVGAEALPVPPPPETVAEPVRLPPGAEPSADEPQPAPGPPEIPREVHSGEAMEPDVTIIKRAEETVQEYRLNGRLYMVKISPKVGPAYYLVDNDGDGRLETRGDLESGLRVPQWVLFRW